MDNHDAEAAPQREKTVAELAQYLDDAHEIVKATRDASEKAQASLKRAIEDERRAYAAFNAAVDAMRPKRPRKTGTAKKGNEP